MIIGLALSIFSLALVVFSLVGVLLPANLVGLVDKVASGKQGLWSAVFIRLILATLLWLNSQVSHTPMLFKAISVMLVLSAFAHLIVGRDRLGTFRKVLASWPRWAIQLPCLLGVVMGVFILWSLSPSAGGVGSVPISRWCGASKIF